MEILIPASLLIDPIKQAISCPCIIYYTYFTFLLFRFPTPRYKFRRRAPKEHRIMAHRKLITKFGIYLCCRKQYKGKERITKPCLPMYKKRHIKVSNERKATLQKVW